MTGRPSNLTAAGMARLRDVYLQRKAIGAIPSDRELARELGVAHPTLRRAFERIRLELRAEADRAERETRQRASRGVNGTR
jgi:DNA-binding FadR family transcriptional regulator